MRNDENSQYLLIKINCDHGNPVKIESTGDEAGT